MSPWFFPLPFCSCFMNCHNSSLKSTSLIVLESNFPSILFLKSLSFLTYCPTHLFSLSPFPMSLFFLLLASFFLLKTASLMISVPCKYISVFFQSIYPCSPLGSLSASLCLINFLQKKVKAVHCSVQLKVQICRSKMP